MEKKINIGDKVGHDVASKNSPNHVGVIKKITPFKELISYEVQFRDFTNYYTHQYVIENLIN